MNESTLKGLKKDSTGNIIKAKDSGLLIHGGGWSESSLDNQKGSNKYTDSPNVEFWKTSLCFRQELRSLRSLPSLQCKLASRSRAFRSKRHADDFASQGVDNIPKLLENVLSSKPINIGSNAKGLFADYMFKGNKYRVAYGTNGFVVSFYPID